LEVQLSTVWYLWAKFLKGTIVKEIFMQSSIALIIVIIYIILITGLCTQIEQLIHLWIHILVIFIIITVKVHLSMTIMHWCKLVINSQIKSHISLLQIIVVLSLTCWQYNLAAISFAFKLLVMTLIRCHYRWKRPKNSTS